MCLRILGLWRSFFVIVTVAIATVTLLYLPYSQFDDALYVQERNWKRFANITETWDVQAKRTTGEYT